MYFIKFSVLEIHVEVAMFAVLRDAQEELELTSVL